MKCLTFNFNGILDDVEDELVRRGHDILPHHTEDGKLIDWKQADVVVTWQETDLGGWKDQIRAFKAEGIPVVLMQHGRRGTSRIYPPFNEELVSDYVCVWGENDVRRLTECGVPRERIFVTGTPVLKRVKPRLKHTGTNVVFSPEHWDEDVMENAIVAGALRRIPDVTIITKILEGEHNPHNYDNPVSSNRQKPDHLDIATSVLQNADAVVAVSESTFELLAQSMDIPVIIADIWVPKACAGDDRYKTYKREYSDAVEMVKDVSKLGDAIKKHIKHPELLREQRKNIVQMDGGNIINPTDEIIKVIEHARDDAKRSSGVSEGPDNGQEGVRRGVRGRTVHGGTKKVRKGSHRD